MKTRRLFKEDVYMKEAEALITGVLEKDGQTVITLDQTVFFPEGGGQSSDLGVIGGHEVTYVYEDSEDIYHVLGKTGPNAVKIKEGASVKMSIDWARRFDNMQRHCGEHILTGVFYREYGGVNRGFHMGDEYMTIDISLEENPEFKTVTWEMAKNAELMANEIIWEEMPMIIQHFDTRAEAEKFPMRKKLAIEEDITLVGIGSTEYGWGCVACCGTHPANTGQVGMIKVFKVESNKGMFRIYFEAGRRAFLRYQQEMDTMQELAKKLSAGSDDIIEKYEAQQQRVKEKGNRLHLITKEVIARETDQLASDIKNGVNLDREGYAVRRYRILSLDDMNALTREASQKIDKLAFLIHEPSLTVFLVSDGKTDCGALVKNNASIYGGKGGGSKNTARAIFSKEEYIDTFVDLIEKHLR